MATDIFGGNGKDVEWGITVYVCVCVCVCVCVRDGGVACVLQQSWGKGREGKGKTERGCQVVRAVERLRLLPRLSRRLLRDH